jgi:26S proteasome regulatory subunit N13
MDTSTHEKHLYAFKAGRAFRRGTTNFVDPAPEKGILSVRNEADGLLHLYWANRETQQVDLVKRIRTTARTISRLSYESYYQDLILFPEEASLIRVAQATEGRVCVLKFTSSDQRHFVSLASS